MVSIRDGLACLALSSAVACAGCGWVPKTQIAACQTQNRTLAEQNKAQVAEIENLKVHTRNVEDQLIRAEEDLAHLDDQNGRERQKLANFTNERQRLAQQLGTAGGPAIPSAIGSKLENLSQRFPSLQYDVKSGVSKLDTDLLFDSGDTELKAGGEKMLREFADIFQSPEGRDLKIMVVGHTDTRGIKGREVRERYPTNWHLSAGRAVSVAQRLRQAGIPEDRMGVAGFGEHQPISRNDSADNRRKNRRVEIFVVGPETPVVGWTETHGSVYR